MKDLSIEATKYTPQIITNLQNGTIDIIGKSYPENTFEFYKPLMDWIEEYFNSPNSETVINIEIIYFNSSSSKLLFDLFDLLEEHNDLSNLTINWIYDRENESAIEAGEDFIEDFEDLNIILVEKED